jgi:anti-sigma factor RsiW
MSDAISELSEQEIADLCALADGTLPAERRAAVEAMVAASPELQRLLDRQRRALAATRTIATEPVPSPLRAAIEGRRRSPGRLRSRPRLMTPRLAAAGAIAAALVAVLFVVLIDGPAGPTVAEAASLTQLEPSEPAPSPLGEDGTRLDEDVEGVEFPDLARAYGWQAVGVRRDSLEGRQATTVFYEKGTSRIAYVIVSGPGLPRPAGVEEVLGGVRYQTFEVGGRPAVTWQRDGHTCVLTGDVPPDELLALASWRGDGTLRY